MCVCLHLVMKKKKKRCIQNGPDVFTAVCIYYISINKLLLTLCRFLFSPLQKLLKMKITLLFLVSVKHLLEKI